MDAKQISHRLLQWYYPNARRYPWRDEPTPYHVWISEIMLQQTRIEAALPYYQRFISALPDVSALASVSQEDLLKLWEGLGYYSRARNLQKAAKEIMNRYNGELPADYRALLSLPGIGAYTAGAISSIAFSLPTTAVDGNVMRVLSRLTADNTDVLSTEGKKHFTVLAEQLLPAEDPGAFNQALMELGETICLPNGVPKCDICPLNEHCAAYAQGNPQEYPTRIKKGSRRVEFRQVAVVVTDNAPPAVLLHKRPETGLLAGLWELPNTEDEAVLTAIPHTVKTECIFRQSLPSSHHLFSHIEWRMEGHLYSVPQRISLPEDYAWATFSELQSAFPLPGAFKVYTKLFKDLLSEER